MKLGPEHIGKKITSSVNALSDLYTILAVKEQRCWLEASDGYNFICDCDNNWELVEEPKRPSERINEILCDELRTSISSSFTIQETPVTSHHINAIKKYLDEQWEKK